MSRLSTLKDILLNALGPSGAQDADQELFDELTIEREQLLKVFDFGARSPQEFRELESGKITVDGRPLAVNVEFARQVAFLSQHLQCSERFCAGVLHSVLSENPNIDQVQAVEQAVVEYHRIRRDEADCLRFIFEAANLAQQGYGLRIHARLNDYAKRYLIVNGGESAVAYRVLAEIERLGQTIAKTKSDVTQAVSNTYISSPQDPKSQLGHGILTARLESLLYERRTLATAFFFIARAGYLTSAEARQMIQWLMQNPGDDATYYLLAGLLATFDLSHSAPGTASAILREALLKDPSLLSFVNGKLGPTSEWKDAALKATVSLKWTLFLTEARLRDPSLENREGFKNEDLEMQILTAVQADAFAFLTRTVVELGPRRTSTTQLLASLALSIDAESKPFVDDEFKPYLLREFELLLRSLLTHAPAELRKIKHRQEDQFRPRSDRRTSLRSTEAPVDKTSTLPRNDIAALFQLIGMLYASLPPNSAIQFWGGVPSTETPAYYELVEADRGKLPSFLRWAIEMRDADLIISAFDMLAGLATGQTCSECAYNFMASGSLDVVHGAVSRYETGAAFTWGSIFGELESWAALGVNQRGAHNMAPQQLPLAPKDVLLGMSFLKLLSCVVTHSVQARIAVASHPQYRAIPSLVSLIPLGVPLELKGSIFGTLSAFCQPGAGIQGVEICRNVWIVMERLEVINVRGASVASKGVEIELEEVESVYKVYPATIPFLELLSALIHTPKRVPLKNRVMEPEPVNTIPDGLGQPYRHPGISPFVAFVVDTVLSNIPRREYLNPADSWKMTDLALCFVERCLASYDLESLPSLGEEYSMKGAEVLVPMLQHPGFDVLTRILSDSPLRSTLVTYVVEGSEELAKDKSREPAFASVIVRALRIVERVLAIQDMFLEQLVPVLSTFDSASITGKTVSSSFLTRLDQGLSFDQRSVPAIASYINHPTHPELIYLSTRVLTALGQSNAFHNIASMVERSSDSQIILDGFVRFLSAPSTEDLVSAEEWADLWTGAGASDIEAPDNFTQAIRLAILDLLLKLMQNQKSYSLAFLLLFGSSTVDKQIQDPHALESRVFCFHVILQLLNVGVPRLRGKDRERERRRLGQSAPLFVTQPALAQRLYSLIYQLCIHPRISSAVMLYLRTREDFFARHLSAMTFQAPVDEQPSFIEVVHYDGSRIMTTCRTLKAFLQLRSSVLDLVSLELHMLTNKNQNQRVHELLDLILGSTEVYRNSETEWEDEAFRPFNDVSQSRIRIIELFQSLEFEWYDSVAITPMTLEFYKQLNLQTCLRVDETGCEVVDRAALFELLSRARATLLSRGQVTTVAHSQKLDEETKYILESCVVENNRREVEFALVSGYESWKKLVDVVLIKCFNRIAHDQRESIVFDMLHVIPPSIRSASLPEPSAVLIAEVVLLLVTKLREERRQLQVASAAPIDEVNALPQERMYALLRNVLEAVLDNRRKELVRGNLYAALVNYFDLVSSTSDPSSILLSLDGLRPSSSLIRGDSFSSNFSMATNGRSTHASKDTLETGTLAILTEVMDRLVTTISRDAIDGTEVWKTVAFTLLNSLARVTRFDKRHQLLSSLHRYGLLANFVHGLKESDQSLQAVLRPDPDDLNPLYVYEAKLSFLIRLAQSRQGAERLLEARVFPTLAQVEFLDARPEADEAFVDRDSFLPSAIARYHQLLMPALQLVESVLATLGSRHSTAYKQVLDFLQTHRETFIISLKESTSEASLATVEELDRIVSLCTLVVHSVPKTDLLAVQSSFGGLHHAILALAAKYLHLKRWNRLIKPSDETEAIEANTRASGYGAHGSKFDVKVKQTGQRFRRTIISYLSSASGVSESELTVVLSPVTTSRKDDRSSGITVPLPSLSDAIEALNDFCDDLSATLQQIVDASAELELKQHIKTDNIEEIVDTMDSESLRRMDMGQRQALVARVLEQNRWESRMKAANCLYTSEMLLLLIWRHIAYYAEGRAPSMPSADLQKSQLRSSTMRFLIVPNTTNFQREAAQALERVLEKVEAVQLSEDLVGKDWRSNRTYIEIMCRRIREALSYDDEGGQNQV